MKKKLICILLLTNINVYACEKIMNDDYIFKYDYNKNVIHYYIEKKDKSNFNFYSKNFYENPIEVGFLVLGDKKINNYENIIHNKNDYYYYRQKYIQLYEKNSNNSLAKYEIGGKEKTFPIPLKEFLNTHKITREANIYNIRNYLESPENNNFLYNKQKVVFTIRLPLDEKINSCLMFETLPIEYDFGGKFWWKIKEIKNTLFATVGF